MSVGLGRLSLSLPGGFCEAEEHPLNDNWNYYIFKYERVAKWENCIKLISEFSTVERFWSLLLGTQRVSELQKGTDVLTFKSNIEPKWEAPQNQNGGRWLMANIFKDDVDRYWEEILMLLIGSAWETDVEDEQVCGAVFQSRSRGSKLSVWTSDASDVETVMRIGRRVKNVVRYPDPLFYQTVEEQKVASRGTDVLSGTYKID